MKTIVELVNEAAMIHATEQCGEVSADGILAALVALEIAAHQQATARAATPAQSPRINVGGYDAVRDWVAQYPRLRATASDIYRSVYHEEPTTADSRAVAGVLRDCGMVPARSNGKLVWKHGV